MLVQLISLVSRVLIFVSGTSCLVLGLLLLEFYSGSINTKHNQEVFEIYDGESLHHVFNRLKENKTLNSPHFWMIMSKISISKSPLKAGEYQLKKGTSPHGLREMFFKGRIYLRSHTIVEGWTLKRLLQSLKDNPDLTKTLPELTAPSELGSLMGVEFENTHPEGLFYPDTYSFPKGFKDIDLLKNSYRKMQNFVQAEWINKDQRLPIATPYDALILASIVEKESGLINEQPHVASVYLNRLEDGMKLQADPTVIYGLSGDYHLRITYKDLKISTPYNTYLNKGLPPTPIAIPSPSAIQAVLHPMYTDDFYFVVTKDGPHKFSKNIEEHLEAVREYRKKDKN